MSPPSQAKWQAYWWHGCWYAKGSDGTHLLIARAPKGQTYEETARVVALALNQAG